MRKGHFIAGFNALEHMSSKNYHVADTNGRAYLCDCCKSVWQRNPNGVGRRLAHMIEFRGSLQSRLSGGGRLFIFQRNLERLNEKRTYQEEITNDASN